jgi:hypothetical protein
MTWAAVELKVAEDSKMVGERVGPNVSQMVCYDNL